MKKKRGEAKILKARQKWEYQETPPKKRD